MDIKSIIERVKPHFLALGLGLVGLILVVVGYLSFISSKKEQSAIVFEQASISTDAPKAEKSITVDVAGGVVQPGVYSLPDGARMQDAVVAAGGMSDSANHEVVARTINFAAKLTDGAKIYIPTKEDREIGTLQSGGSSVVAGTETININTASSKDLDTLPGIGEVTAQKIISGRPYASVDDLLSKKIVSKKVFDQIKDKVAIY